MDPTNDAKSSLNASQRIEVKELFGLLLDADEAGHSSATSSQQIISIADEAIGSASSAVASAAKLLMDAHHRADTGLLCESDGFNALSGDYEQNIGSKVTPPIIDGYRVYEEIGRGGFGVVYRAQQLVPVQRAVAIKLLRTDLATPEMVARFQSEASVLARMNHEGIARVIDAGIDHDSRPFVAMDLIEGVPIVEYCQKQTIPTRDRARLIEQVCDAVHHAHQRAVIHRDLKPANVLVESYNHQARPRVIDFGIAKLLEDGVVETHTLAGRRLGTPRYMSPEQRSGDGDIDIRIDVYALGVLLCETLTGKVPHGSIGTKRSNSGTRPSGLVDDATHKNIVLSRELKGDLDRIVLKAIATDPDMRYQSAAAMSEDLRRYLDGRPVLAKDAGIVYRSTKFVLRHKMSSAFASIAVIALITGGVGLGVGFSRATTSGDIARTALADSERQLLRAEFVNRFLLEDMLAVIDPNVSHGRDITVREVFDIASERLTEREDLDIETQYTTLRLIGMVYSEIGAHDEAMGAFERAAELAERYHGGPCREAIEIRMSLLDIIVSNGRSGMTKLSERLNQDAQALLNPSDPLYQSIRIRTSDTIEELNAILLSFESDPDADPREHLKVLSSLGNLYSFAFHPAEELGIRKRAYDLSNEIYGPDHSATFNRLGHYAALRMGNDPSEETLDLLYRAYEPARRILGLEHPTTLSSMRTYANLLGKLKDPEEAIRLLEECERGYRARFGASSTSHTGTCSVLGEHYLRAGRVDEALMLLLQVRDDRARQWSAGHVFNAVAHMNIAKCYIELGNGEGAQGEAIAALEIVKANSLRESESILLLAKAHVILKQLQKADIEAQRGVTIFRRLEPSSSLYFDVGDEFVSVLESIGDLDGAQALREFLESAKNTL